MTPRSTPRRNAEGLWRCGTCEAYLPPEQFTVDHRRHEPYGYCRACRRAYESRRRARLAMDDAWWQQALERNRPSVTRWTRKKARRRRAAREERSKVAGWMLGEIRAHGLTRANVEAVAGITARTQVRIEAGEPVWKRAVLERLLLLHHACQEFPRLQRTHGSPLHPYLPQITHRYRALREAHA